MSCKQPCNKQSLTISAAEPIINPQINTKLEFFVMLYPFLILCTSKSGKLSCMEYLALWGKYLHTWHPVLICGYQKGSRGWTIITTFIPVYCLLHVLVVMKNQNQAIKNVHKER